MRDTVQTIKDTLKMQDIFLQYGFTQNRSGFICCPFHSEKTASCGTYANDTRWKCFGCGAGGDVIGFVQKLYGISFPQAVMRICSDFGISAPTAGTMVPAEVAARKIREEHEREQKELMAYREEWEKHFSAFLDCEETLYWCKPLALGEPMLPEFVRACTEIDLEWEWICAHPWK